MSLFLINSHKARSVEKSENMANTDTQTDYSVDDARLAYAKIEGPAAVQAYIAEDKNYVCMNISYHATCSNSIVERTSRSSISFHVASASGQCHCGVRLHCAPRIS